MPLYTPTTSATDFRGGKNILASEHLQFVEAAATLDAQAFGAGFHDVGKTIGRNTSTGMWEPVAEAEDLDGFDDFGILNVDWNSNGEDNVIAGEVIVRGSVYEAKLADEVTDAFRESTPNIRYVKHV